MCMGGYCCCPLKLPGDDVDLCGIAKLGQELIAVFPGVAEGAHVGDADPGDNVTNGRKIGWIEFAVHYRRFCPVHQAAQRQFMAQMGGKLFGDGLACDESHGRQTFDALSLTQRVVVWRARSNAL